ncbi:MAG: hypothetical protein MJZ37_08980 [Bacilli bacterium]|nr:hypothetical protein [Bacilli bacterium]
MQKKIRLIMTPEEKGYECCNNCEICTVKYTDCIVFSKKGKAKYKKFVENQKKGVLK